MKNKFKRMILLQVLLAILILVLGVYIYMYNHPSRLPDTRIFITNTTIVGKIVASVI